MRNKKSKKWKFSFWGLWKTNIVIEVFAQHFLFPYFFFLIAFQEIKKPPASEDEWLYLFENA